MAEKRDVADDIRSLRQLARIKRIVVTALLEKAAEECKMIDRILEDVDALQADGKRPLKRRKIG